MALGKLLDRWWIIFLADRSPACCMAHHPGFTEIIKATGSSTLLITFFFGLLWGIGGLTYGFGSPVSWCVIR
jgi:hypothetical protein